MAANDYVDRGKGPMCPVGSLGNPLGYLDDTLTIAAFQDADEDIRVGSAALIGDEIVKITAITWPSMTVLRGCADTIPAEHVAGERCWFFSNNAGSDGREYSATQTIAIKARPFGMTGDATPVENTPPMALTFNWRMLRPYPPGDVRVGTDSCFAGRFQMAVGVDELNFSWKHRDRILQADQLVGHLNDSIGPEPGTTYTVRVMEAPGNLRRTVVGITDPQWQYTRAMAQSDLLLTGIAQIELYAVRDGLESLQGYSIGIEVLGLTFAEDETEFNFKTAGYAPASGTVEVDFINHPYIPPTHP